MSDPTIIPDTGRADREAASRQVMTDLYSRIEQREAAAYYAASLAKEFRTDDEPLSGPPLDATTDEAKAWRWRYILDTLHQRTQTLRVGVEDAEAAAADWTSWADDLARLAGMSPNTDPVFDLVTGEVGPVVPAYLDPAELLARAAVLVSEADAIAAAYTRRARALASDRYRTEENLTNLHATPPAGHDDAGQTGQEDPA